MVVVVLLFLKADFWWRKNQSELSRARKSVKKRRIYRHKKCFKNQNNYDRKCSRLIWTLYLTGDTCCNGSSPSCRTLSLVPAPARLYLTLLRTNVSDCCLGYFRRLHNFLPLVPPSLPPALSCHNQYTRWSLKPPKPWLNLHHWNARVWAGIHSIRAVNYILLIYSSQNDNCPPWQNATMCDLLPQIGLIASSKWDEENKK